MRWKVPILVACVLACPQRGPAHEAKAPPPSPRIDMPAFSGFDTRFEQYFEPHFRAGHRIHIQTDKPLYQPGETIWIKTWDLKARSLAGVRGKSWATYELVNPKGAVIRQKLVENREGLATNDFALAPDLAGGLYTLRMRAGVHVVTRPIVISTYESPRIKKKLELLRKAYGPGDRVAATLDIKRPTGQPLKDHPIRPTVWLDGERITLAETTTNEAGKALIAFELPKRIDRGDGTLTVLVADGGITESVSKPIPILLKKLQLAMYPEGGQLIEGLPNRLYFEAKTPLGKPADIAGRVIDDLGNTVATFESYHFGLGRIAFTPSAGRRYDVQITQPAGIEPLYPVPVAAEQGCVLRTFDDVDGRWPQIRVAVRCTEERQVAVAATLRERMIDVAGLRASPTRPAIAYLKSKDEALNRARGIARVTLFDDNKAPLAERLVFRNRKRGLRVEVQADQDRYVPREQVALTVRTTDDQGRPVASELALSVVDDTVLSYADDKTGHMLAKILLEPELPGELEEPNFFFDLKNDKSARAMELLMGTRGWRKFEWRPILANVDGGTALKPYPSTILPASESAIAERRAGPRDRPKLDGIALAPRPLGKLAAARPKAKKAPKPAPAAQPQGAAKQKRPAPPRRARRRRAERAPAHAGLKADAHFELEEGIVWNRDRRRRDITPPAAPVRVFVAPAYTGSFDGPRTDFRETIHWAPNVRTGQNGKAVVTFYLSDAITSFRVLTEGRGGGLIGRAERVIESSLPFSMAVKLPLEVSAGDRILMPLTLTNEQSTPLSVSLTEQWGSQLRLGEDIERPSPQLTGQARRSVFYPLSVVGQSGTTEISLSANAGGLQDELTRKLKVVPLGFPVTLSESGSLQTTVDVEIDFTPAIEGTATTKITLYPSPLATLLSGLDGMLREPFGCFEQTSSTNYPNVMIMQYLRLTDSPDPTVIERATALMNRGYKKLVGFEAKGKGYEWFGRSPAHEALTAYGLLEFADMKQVYPDVDPAMVDRTARWLLARRDNQGGFRRDPQALDSFGRAAPQITNMYILYALVEAGYTDLPRELEAQARVIAQSRDPYVLALGARLLLKAGPAYRDRGQAAARRLASMQKPDGHWAGTRHSITRSTGRNLNVETTALAILALITAGDSPDRLRGGIEWLTKSRSGHGAFGATQATVLALKALTEYALDRRRRTQPGAVTVFVNGQKAGRHPYGAQPSEPIVVQLDHAAFEPGKNTIRLEHTGESRLPYSIAAEYRAVQPPNHPDAVVHLRTSLEQTALKMGDTVRLTATVSNTTEQGQPMTMVRVGLPGGLMYQTWQLKQLVERKVVAFYETKAREVILYLRDLKPSQTKRIPIDLVAAVPGRYTGPASRAYLYYTDDQKVWTDPLQVQISP